MLHVDLSTFHFAEFNALREQLNRKVYLLPVASVCDGCSVRCVYRDRSGLHPHGAIIAQNPQLGIPHAHLSEEEMNYLPVRQLTLLLLLGCLLLERAQFFERNWLAVQGFKNIKMLVTFGSRDAL